MPHDSYHDEVLSALIAIGNPRLGLHIPKDRRSELLYCGVRVPNRRKRVEQGFSFSTGTPDEVLNIWDNLWKSSNNGDVMHCALDYCQSQVRKTVNPNWWSILRTWISRIENWAHADGLSGIYARFLAADRDVVLPQIKNWIASEDLWTRRVGLVSTIRYTGKNAVFLPSELAFSLIEPTLDDHRYYIQKGSGWVLRELQQVYPHDFETFLNTHLDRIGAIALTRAIEKLAPEERQSWREQKKVLTVTNLA